MHDVGEMILVHGDPKGFEKLGEEVQQTGSQMVDKEQEVYDFDHTLIGMTLLESWNIDAKIAQAVLNHHSDVGEDQNNELAGFLAVADYACFKAGLGFFAEPPVPPAPSLTRCHLDEAQSANEVIAEIQKAYQEESALFKPA
jgi:hypothetical protein